MKKRILAVLLWIDRWFQDHWFHGGDETISSHLGKLEVRYGGLIPWTRPVQAALSRFLDWLDSGHCVRSIETTD